MARDRKDRSANWYMAHHGGALLRLANLSNIVEWKAVQNVLGFPKQIPDGLLDVTFAGKTTPDPFLIEIEAYPDGGTMKQIRRDLAMVMLVRDVIPDMLVLVMRPKGRLRIVPDQVLASAHGLSEVRFKVHVVNLWELSAEELLATGDVGLIPWVPLTNYAGSARTLLQKCRDRIEEQAPGEEKENLLAVTHTTVEMRYNSAELLSLFGGQIMSFTRAMLATPAGLRFLAEEARKAKVQAAKAAARAQAAVARKYIRDFLLMRFNDLPRSIEVKLRAIHDQKKLDKLVKVASACPAMSDFEMALDQS